LGSPKLFPGCFVTSRWILALRLQYSECKGEGYIGGRGGGTVGTMGDGGEPVSPRPFLAAAVGLCPEDPAAGCCGMGVGWVASFVNSRCLEGVDHNCWRTGSSFKDLLVKLASECATRLCYGSLPSHVFNPSFSLSLSLPLFFPRSPSVSASLTLASIHLLFLHLSHAHADTHTHTHTHTHTLRTNIH